MLLEDFDLEVVHEEKIAPLIDQIIAISEEYELPMMAYFLYKTEATEHYWCATNLTYPGRNPVENRTVDMFMGPNSRGAEPLPQEEPNA